jgi:hypothetical protein
MGSPQTFFGTYMKARNVKTINLSRIHEYESQTFSHESCSIRELDGTPAQYFLTSNLKHATPRFMQP